MIIQNEPISADHKADLSFTVDRDDLATATEVLDSLDLGERILTDERIGKVSIVGAGMRSHPGVAAKVFETLGSNEINIEDDLHLPDQDLLRDRCRPGPRRREGAARGVRAGGADAVRREEPTGAEHRPRVAP